MWKYFAIAAIALIVGAVASPLIMRYIANSTLHDSQVELMEVWSSEGNDWTEFSRFIEAGGRAYWSGTVVFNYLEKKMDEEDIRRSIGSPGHVMPLHLVRSGTDHHDVDILTTERRKRPQRARM